MKEHSLQCTCPRCVSAMARANMATKAWAVLTARGKLDPLTFRFRGEAASMLGDGERVVRVLLVPLGRPRRGKKAK